jgi:MFS transporter, DHA3 family, macrolide efflux protein
VTDSATAAPEELREPELPGERPLALLRRPDFRRTYAAIAISELGDAFQYVALMWVALLAGGPLGVIAVRLADSVPALVFGLHGGVVADRLDRRRTMIAADVVRGTVLIPVAAAGLAGHLPLYGLVLAAFALTAATSYFAPAYGALLPSLVERRNVQQANGLVRATADALNVIGWSLAALLLTFLPISLFFALNAASFFLSALVLMRVRSTPTVAADAAAGPPRVREGVAALMPRPALAVAVAVLGIAVTVSSGTWIVGVPELVRTTLDRGAGSFSLVAAAYALGSIAVGIALAHRVIRRKALGSLVAWSIYLPAYGLFAVADTLGVALLGAFGAGVAQGSAWVLVNSAAQEEVPDRFLGRVMGLISLVHRGAHATGLLFVAPLFALVEPGAVFGAAGLVIAATGLIGLAVARGRGAEARAHA